MSQACSGGSDGAGPRGVADFRHHGAADRCPRWWPGGDALLGHARIAAKRNSHDVPADERLPRGPMAEADPRERPLADMNAQTVTLFRGPKRPRVQQTRDTGAGR
jgi:hypothetical protein